MAAVIGRDHDLAALTDFVNRVPAGPMALLVEGEAGIGKTTLWNWGVAEAQRRRFRVMTSRPLASETQMSFSALGDLLEDALEDAISGLPRPQQRALEVALLRTEAKEAALEPRAVSVAFLGAVRVLAEQGPILIAVDDVQWLDPTSARVLAFTLHRLAHEPVGVLAALREEKGSRDSLELDRALPEGALARLHVTPLSTALITHLLRDRFRDALSFPLVQQIASTSAGNPFLAIQIGEILKAGRSYPAPGEPLPVPEQLREVIQARLDGLPAVARDAVAVCALSARPTLPLASCVMGERARRGLRGAADASVLRLEGSQVAFAHPLLRAAAHSSLTPRQRRALHRRLAACVDDPEERGRHLALAAEGPDPSVASMLDAGARHARARGAPAAGAELLELARRLTDRDDTDALHRRTLKASECHFEAGDVERSRSLLRALEAASPCGPRRAEALLYLCDTLWCDIRAIKPVLRRALDEISGSAPLELRIEVLVDLAWVGILGGNLLDGRRHARDALDLAERLGDAAFLSRAFLAVGHAEFFMGVEADHVMRRAVALQSALQGRQLLTSPRRKLGAHLMWAGAFEEARAELERDRQDTLQRGQLTDLGEVSAHLAELEIRTGNWESAAMYATEGCESMIDSGFETALEIPLSTMALVEARRGEVEHSRAHATKGLALAEAHDYRLEVIRNQWVLGFLELSQGNPSRALDYLAPLPDLATSMGLREPGVFPFVPDLVEALVALGEVTEAEPVVEWLEERGRELDRALARATAARCSALIAAARGDFPTSLHALDEAIVEHERVREPFELARTLLVAGEVRRRHKERRKARDSFRAAQEIFDRLGARLWSERARNELHRVGDRAASATELTPTEQRVAALVAEGRTNREVAAAMFVSVKTVEANLSRIYHKTGVRSRTELAHRMTSPADVPGVEGSA